MNIKWYYRIQSQLSTILIVLMTFFLIAFCFYSYSVAKKFMHDELNRYTEITTTRMANSLKKPISRFDKKQVKEIIEWELKDERIASIIVMNPVGGIVATVGTPQNGNPSGTKIILYENKKLGLVKLYVLPGFMQGEMKKILIKIYFMAAALLVTIFLILLILLRRYLISPIAELTRATEDISLGKLDKAIFIKSKNLKNELGSLANAIERMRNSIRIAMEHLARKKKMPGVEAKEWTDVILGKKRYNFEFLALQILVGRLVVTYRNSPNPDTMKKCTRQLINFFQKEKNPQAQKDYRKIFGGVKL